jgi:hypothetical protein
LPGRFWPWGPLGMGFSSVLGENNARIERRAEGYKCTASRPPRMPLRCPLNREEREHNCKWHPNPKG